jgi:hypothetical protein
MRRNAWRLTISTCIALLALLGSGPCISAVRAQTLPSAVTLSVPASAARVELHEGFRVA